MKLLFLLKKNYNYGNYQTYKAGLFNSCTLLKQMLEDKLDIDVSVDVAVDGNDVNRQLVAYKPDICILEAIWVQPNKLKELVKLHPNIAFIVRVHSKTPFLATEGMAIKWLKEYVDIEHTHIAFNNKQTHTEYVMCGLTNYYLPNLYPIENRNCQLRDVNRDEIIHIGCLGALRPMKNQLLQAVAAIRWGYKHGRVVMFHINAERKEQGGEGVLKNLQALFVGTKHMLIEHPWMSHKGFLKLIGRMDLGMQVSMTESFNIVTADFVGEGVPIIVSEDIEWMPAFTKTDDKSSEAIADKIEDALSWPNVFTHTSLYSLNKYNKHSLKEWKKFLNLK